MEVLVFLVPLAIALGGLGLAAFLWSLRPQPAKARKVSSRAPAGAIQVQSGS